MVKQNIKTIPLLTVHFIGDSETATLTFANPICKSYFPEAHTDIIIALGLKDEIVVVVRRQHGVNNTSCCTSGSKRLPYFGHRLHIATG